MSKSSKSSNTPTVIKVDPNAIELEPGMCYVRGKMFCIKLKKLNAVEWNEFTVKNSTNTANGSKEKSIKMDTVDQGCVNCEPKNHIQKKESVSLSISSDEGTEQAISLNMNKKSHNNYKGILLYSELPISKLKASKLKFVKLKYSWCRFNGFCTSHCKCQSIEISDNLQFGREDVYHKCHTDHFIIDRPSGCWHWNDL